MIKSFFKNLFLSEGQYRYHSEAVIIACYYNPTGSDYRYRAFQRWYESIKHLEHRITELVIGNNSYELPKSPYIEEVRTDTLLWHKEALLNRIISKLPKKYKYVFWLDTDVLFTNPNWLIGGVERLQHVQLIQPFEYCVHMQKDEQEPSFDLQHAKALFWNRGRLVPNFWRSFCANFVTNGTIPNSYTDPMHGHVGFAWGARRDILDRIPLYDQALIGGADHIMADAAVSPFTSECIRKNFAGVMMPSIESWSAKWWFLIEGKVDYVGGSLYHIWHGDLEKRNYGRRIREFSPLQSKVVNRDHNGLFVTDDPEPINYFHNYIHHRDAIHDVDSQTQEFVFGGATEGFGGAGAEGSYDTPTDKPIVNDVVDSADSTYESNSLTGTDREWTDNSQNWDTHNGIS